MRDLHSSVRNRPHRTQRATRSHASLPLAQTPPVERRTFDVRCTVCAWRFRVERAPARCPRCGGLSVA